MKATLTFTFLATAVFMSACAAEDPNALGRHDNGGDETTPPGEPDPTNPADPNDPSTCAGREYVGFGKTTLSAGRVPANVGVDRRRMKPFSALGAEYARVLGATPASLKGSGATFGQAPARWYEEPQANAVALQTAYTIAFDGCLTYTATAPEFASAPDAASAATQCSAMAAKFWNKTPGPQEIAACADVATKGAATEPDARRKWAYACASVLTAAGFLTY